MYEKNSDYFQLNIECLKSNHPDLYQFVFSGDIKPEGKIQLAPNGKPNLIIQSKNGNSVYIHDESDPEKESGNFLDLIPEKDTGVVLFLGMGLGYGSVAVALQRPHLQHIVIFELSPGIFLQALQARDLRSMLMDKRVSLHVGELENIDKTLSPLTRSLQLENIHFLKLSREISVFSEAYQTLHDGLFKYVNALNISGTTVRKYGEIFLKNRFENLATIHHQLIFDSLKGAFTDVPAILIAAGPSLQKDLHLLPLTKGRAVIIAVDTVLPVLLQNGIIPDFMTTIDPKELVFEKIADILPKVPSGIHLISTISGSPKIAKTFPATQTYWTFTAKPIEVWMNRLLGGEMLTAGAGTVAHLNLLSAVFMGCSPIIFVGQDLAHSKSESHVPGVSLSSPNRTNKILENIKDLLWVKAVDGNLVPTDRGFNDMRHYFERIISENPGHYINATRRGAHIEGTEVLSLTETLKRYASKFYSISGQMEALAGKRLNYDKEHFVQSCGGLISQIEDIRQHIIKYANLISKTKKQIRKLGKNKKRIRGFSDLPQSVQNLIQNIDHLSNLTDKASNIWELVQELTMDGLCESERQKQTIERLGNDPKQYLQWLLKNLDRLGYVNEVHEKTIDIFYQCITKALNFYQKEQSLLESIAKAEDEKGTLEDLIQLADLYMEFEDYNLAKPLLEQIRSMWPDNADTHYKLGLISLHRRDNEMLEKHFQHAFELCPQFQTKIQKVRHEFGEMYLDHAKRFGEPSVKRRMLAKGLRCCSDHEELIKLKHQMACEDLSTVESEAVSGNLDKVENVMDFWTDLATWELQGNTSLPADMVAGFCIYAAKLRFERGDLEEAEAKIKIALEKNPDHLEGLQTMVEICFALGNFESGIHYLQHAIQLDSKAAILWQRLGDRLLSAGQYANAVSAYEQCFLYFPEKTKLLKKIGECYLKMKNYDAAKQALQFFRDRQGS